MSVSTPTLSPNPWLRILDALEKKINRHSYDTWLKPTRYSHSSGGVLFVRVPTVEQNSTTGMAVARGLEPGIVDRKSTRLNSSHEWISYAVFCLQKKKE